MGGFQKEDEQEQEQGPKGTTGQQTEQATVRNETNEMKTQSNKAP